MKVELVKGIRLAHMAKAFTLPCLSCPVRCWRTISVESPSKETSGCYWEHLSAQIWQKISYFSVVCSSHSSTTVFPCAVCYHKPGIMAGSLSAMMGQLRFLMPTGLNFRTAKGSYLASEHVSTATQYSWFTVLCPSSHHTPLCSFTFDHTTSQVASLASHSPGQTRNSEVSGAEVFVYFPRTLSQRPVSLSV